MVIVANGTYSHPTDILYLRLDILLSKQQGQQGSGLDQPIMSISSKADYSQTCLKQPLKK